MLLYMFFYGIILIEGSGCDSNSNIIWAIAAYDHSYVGSPDQLRIIRSREGSLVHFPIPDYLLFRQTLYKLWYVLYSYNFSRSISLHSWKFTLKYSKPYDVLYVLQNTRGEWELLKSIISILQRDTCQMAQSFHCTSKV